MIKIEKGMCLKVRTKSHEDVFGTCVYEVVEAGLPAPEAHRSGKMDGVKCMLLGGSGRAAQGRDGLIVPDSEFTINQNILSGITEVVNKERGMQILEELKKSSAKSVVGGGRPATGCVEIES